jgi:hypothetical protein
MLMKYFFWLGPSLFLIAKLILPGGSSDVGKLIEIIKANQSTWEWGHRLIIVALALLIPWLARIYRKAKKGHPACYRTAKTKAPSFCPLSESDWSVNFFRWGATKQTHFYPGWHCPRTGKPFYPKTLCSKL